MFILHYPASALLSLIDCQLIYQRGSWFAQASTGMSEATAGPLENILARPVCGENF